MGSAGGEELSEATESCQRLGRAIAGQGCFSPERVLASPTSSSWLRKRLMGTSSAFRPRQACASTSGSAAPVLASDVLIFTGLGLMGRELINIFSSDIVVVVGGRSGNTGRVRHRL